MNYTLLQRMLQVAGARGNVAGTPSSSERNQSGTSRRRILERGRYRLIVDTALEDLAGNKIGQPFDIDVFDRVTERITSSTTTLPFEIHSSHRQNDFADVSSRLNVSVRLGRLSRGNVFATTGRKWPAAKPDSSVSTARRSRSVSLHRCPRFKPNTPRLRFMSDNG